MTGLVLFLHTSLTGKGTYAYLYRESFRGHEKKNSEQQQAQRTTKTASWTLTSCPFQQCRQKERARRERETLNLPRDKGVRSVQRIVHETAHVRPRVVTGLRGCRPRMEMVRSLRHHPAATRKQAAAKHERASRYGCHIHGRYWPKIYGSVQLLLVPSSQWYLRSHFLLLATSGAT